MCLDANTRTLTLPPPAVQPVALGTSTPVPAMRVLTGMRTVTIVHSTLINICMEQGL